MATWDDVVAEDFGQLRNGRVGEGGADVLEGCVVGGEDGEVGSRVDVFV